MLNNTPVLFLIFNRPTLTQRVFNEIKKAKPTRLFIGADGPRADRDEFDLCQETRSIITQVDWPCEVNTLFRDTNLGCGKAPSEAISWFFSHVEQGIILEDDCLPDPSFFTFCDALLEKYAALPTIMSISGTNYLPQGWMANTQSYLFAHVNIWGWATWRRAWKLYNYDIPYWETKPTQDKIRKAMNNINWYEYYYGMFEGVYKKEIDAWDLQWVYCVLMNGGFSITPSLNLVTNIGFGPDATHTAGLQGHYSKMRSNQLMFPLKHPKKIAIDKRYLRAAFKYVFEYDKNFIESTKSWARLYLNRIRKKIIFNSRSPNSKNQ